MRERARSVRRAPAARLCPVRRIGRDQIELRGAHLIAHLSSIPHVADDDLETLPPTVVVAAAHGQRREARLQLDTDAGGGRIACQQQERQRAGAAPDVEEPAVRRGQKPFEQHRIQAHARAARRLVDADAAGPQRVGGDPSSSPGGPAAVTARVRAGAPRRRGGT